MFHVSFSVRSQVCVHSSGLIAPVAYLLLKELKLTDKDVLVRELVSISFLQ